MFLLFVLLARCILLVQGACTGCLPSQPYCLNDNCAGCADGYPCPQACHPSGLCTMCADDSQCANLPYTKRCTPDGTCVQCMNHGHCTPDVAWNKPYCHGSSCVECLSDGDCQVSPRNRCHPSKDCVQCLGNDHCDELSETPVCKDGLCSPCSGSDCSSFTNKACRNDGRCVPCTSNVYCLEPTLPNCRLSDNTCVQCLEHAHCPSIFTLSVEHRSIVYFIIINLRLDIDTSRLKTRTPFSRADETQREQRVKTEMPCI